MPAPENWGWHLLRSTPCVPTVEGAFACSKSHGERTLMGSTWRAVNSRSSRAATCEKHSGQGAVRLKLSPPCVT